MSIKNRKPNAFTDTRLLPLVLFISLLLFAELFKHGAISAPNLPAPSTATVTVNPTTHQISYPPDFAATNSLVTQANLATATNTAASDAATKANAAQTASAPRNGAFIAESLSAASATTNVAAGTINTDSITLNAGSGAYIVNRALAAGTATNQVWEVPVSYPASTNATLAIYDGGITGSPLITSSSTLTAGSTTFQFAWDGAHWNHLPKGALLLKNLGPGVPAAAANAVDNLGGLATHLSVPSGKMYPVESYGGIADGKVITDAVFNGTTTITSAATTFVAGNVNVTNGVNSGGDVGKAVVFYNGLAGTVAGGTTTAGSAVVTGISSTANIRAGMPIYQPLYVQTTATTTSGNTTMTVTSATGLVVGMAIAGPGVSNTTISSISGTTVTLSANATLTNSTAAHFQFFLQNFGTTTTVSSVDSSSQITLSAAVSKTAVTNAAIYFFPTAVQTTITAVNSAHSITVANAASVSFTGGRMHYGTDNTTPIQNACNAVGTANSGTVLFQQGEYLLNGPLQTTGSRNGVVLLPIGGGTGGTSIGLRGTPEQPNDKNGFITNNSPGTSTGTIFFCATPGSGTNPCMFDGSNNTSYGSLTHVNIALNDLTFRTPLNPTLGGVGRLNGGGVNDNNVQADVDYQAGYTLITSFGTGVAFSYPNFNNGNIIRVRSVDVQGYGVGLMAQTAADISNGNIVLCGVGLNLYVNPRIDKIVLLGNFYNFQAYDSSPSVLFGNVSVANSQGPATLLSFSDFDPSSGRGPFYGQLLYDTLSNTYVFGDLNASTCKSLNIALSTSSGTTSINPPGLLQNALTPMQALAAGSSTGFNFLDSSGTMKGNLHLDAFGFGLRGSTSDLQVGLFGADSSGGIVIAPNSKTATIAYPLTVSGAATFTGNNVAIGTLGKTLTLKGGTNAKSGTFTLVAGAATVANTSVTANSVILVTLKTVGGTRAGNPDIVPTSGTGFTATGGGSDTSTYNFSIIEGNQ